MHHHDQPGHVCGVDCPRHGGLPIFNLPAGLTPVATHLGYDRDARAERFPYLAAMRERVVIYDGGFGTELFKYEIDYGGKQTDGCVEMVHLTQPHIATEIHAKYFEAGADVIETHSFNAFPHILAEFGIGDQAERIAELAAQAGRRAAAQFGPGRFVAGSVGSGTKMPSLLAIAWDPLFESYRAGIRGLIRGGSDVILIETAQDLLQVKCAVLAARQAMADLGREVPIQAQVTIETMGTMLTGSDIAAAVTALEAMPIDVIGLNCATGPDLMDSHLRHVAEHATRFVSCLPNAGIPRNVGGKAVYDLTADELARWHAKFITEYGVNAVGGCCGTTPDHIRAVAKAVRGLQPGRKRLDVYTPSLSSIYQSVPIRQDTGILLVGERTNATGSKAFRELLFKDDWDGIVALAQEQVAEGSHVLDVSVAWTGRDEKRDMDEVMKRLATAVRIPIMIDTTQTDVLEVALKRLGGRAIINSVNLEDGEDKLDAVCALAKRYGAALVALTIDEDREAGMAKTADRKLAIAERLHRLITERHGIDEGSILFDLLTFPITQGDEDTRLLGLWTLDGIERVRARFPKCGFILGLSNISFGVKPYARQVLNSVYLDEAIKRGLTSAILNASKIIPLGRLPDSEVAMARDLIHDRRVRDPATGEVLVDPLFRFVDHFTKTTGTIAAGVDPFAGMSTTVRLRQRIIDGKKIGIEADLDQAISEGFTPLSLINDHLLDGMKEVGVRFGAGTMQLPFVLQSAETMKSAVRHLEPKMERAAGSNKGVMVLATVRGDVHDIGKNLVDIILTNNGYKVHNLGIKQPIEDILKAVTEFKPDAIGMSGLLVKSTVVMKENLEYLAARGLKHQVILGGAALNRAYVENDLRNIYNPAILKQPAPGDHAHQVWYATDAFDGLQLMEELCGHVTGDARKLTTRVARTATVKTAYEILAEKLEAGKAYVPSNTPPATRVPRPPFFGRRIVETAELDIPTITSFINKNALFRGQWGFRQGQELSKEQWQELVDREAVPVLKRWIERATTDKMLAPAVVYGFYPAYSERNATVVLHPETGAEVARFDFPRQSLPGSKRLCISDFIRAKGAAPLHDEQTWMPPAAWAAGARDVLAFHCVTMGAIASEHCQRLFKADNYQEYLYFYGLSVESAEALAEYWHKRIRQQWDIAGQDALSIDGLFTQGYQGSRYSFGYPACPRLDDQVQLQALLGWKDIGLELSEEFQLHPEQSTSAIILHHPEASYFNL